MSKRRVGQKENDEAERGGEKDAGGVFGQDELIAEERRCRWGRVFGDCS